MSVPLILSVHDVGPATEAAARGWLRDLDERDLRSTLLVVGGPYRGSGLEAAPEPIVQLLRSRQAAGDEIAQHGWTHCDETPRGVRGLFGRLAARGAAEFWSLSQAEAGRRLAAATAAIERHGIRVSGFTPPGYLASRAAVRAAAELRVPYVASHLWVHDLTTGRRWFAPAFSHRPHGGGERTAAHLVRRGVPAFIRRGIPVRLALHPADRTIPRLRAATLDALDEALAAGARAMTYQQLLSPAMREAA